MPDPISFVVVRVGPTNKAGQRAAEIVYTDGARTVPCMSVVGPEFATVEDFATMYSAKIPKRMARHEARDIEAALERGENPAFTFDYADADEVRKRLMKRMMDPREGFTPRKMARFAPILEERNAQQIANFLDIPTAKAVAFRNFVLAAKTLAVS